MRKTRPALDRFHEKYVVDDETGCWVWTAARGRDGYGRLWVDGKSVLAHRFAYDQFVGPIPDGLVLDHLCRNRACCNPEHLRVCTHRENILATGALSPSAVHSRQTHCIHGHPFDAANTYLRPNGKRDCRACRRRSKAEYRQRRQATRLQASACSQSALPSG